MWTEITVKFNYSGTVAKCNSEVLILSIFILRNFNIDFPFQKEILYFFTVHLSDCSSLRFGLKFSLVRSDILLQIKLPKRIYSD